MKVSRYRWTASGMVYAGKSGIWISRLEHEAVVAAYKAQVEQLLGSKAAQIASLESEVSDKDAALTQALARIEELEATP